MLSTKVQDPQVLVLVDADNPGQANYRRGHLFEEFMARVMELYGYSEPHTTNLNVAADGVEIDIELKGALSGEPAMAECKAYSKPIVASQLTSFYGKLALRRFEDPHIRGYFVAIPRLTPDADNVAKKYQKADSKFRVLNALDLVALLSDKKVIVPIAGTEKLLSDHALVIHGSGLYAACLESDVNSKDLTNVRVGSSQGAVPKVVQELLGTTSYAQGRPVIDNGQPPSVEHAPAVPEDVEEPIIASVRGSTSDFEYQLPASPKFFVGRKKVVATAENALGNSRLLVLNAQSGWGKSSLALRIAHGMKATRQYADVIDARTATRSNYIPAVLRRGGQAAEKAGVLKLGDDATWASLSSALSSLEEAQWFEDGQLLIFFDQFENVFNDEALTQQFRDLALGVRESTKGLLLGFSWKTDFVGFTESFPYHFRDEIRAASTVIQLEPFKAEDVGILLDRLQREVGEKLSPEIRRRLREYSQGLPWLLKKLSGHLIKQINDGMSQEQLASESLNVQGLFQDDLESLSPTEMEALNFVARYAPVPAVEATDRYEAKLIQSLLDQRLVVQVGEKLDTYWDIFRDFLLTGRVPIQESYTIRQTPPSVARLLMEVLKAGGDVAVPDMAARWNTTENAVFNVAREMRLLGLTSHVPNRVQLLPEILTANDIERDIRRRVTSALRKNKAYLAFETAVGKRGDGLLPFDDFARLLPEVFPAVEVADSTWRAYARILVSWLEYAGLAISSGQGIRLAPEGSVGIGSLVGYTGRRRRGRAFPTSPAGPALEMLKRIHAAGGPMPVSYTHLTLPTTPYV